MILRGACSEPGGLSILEPARVLDPLVSRSRVSVLESIEFSGTYEHSYVGLHPDTNTIAPGVLSASAFKLNPPIHTQCFCLNLCGLTNDDRLDGQIPVLEPDEVAEIQSVLARLETSRLLPRWGQGLDHMLFWLDGSRELYTQFSFQVPYSDLLPEGVGDQKLRVFIDDSANLLMSTEVNRIRHGEGIPQIRLLWPWGQGQYGTYPNLPLRRGELVSYESRDLRIAGLVGLYGYKHGDRAKFGKALSPDYRRLLSIQKSQAVSVFVFDQFAEALVKSRFEEADILMNAFWNQFLEPILNQDKTRLQLIATGQSEMQYGLALSYDSERPIGSRFPFDERTFEDKLAPKDQIHAVIARALGS